MDYLDVLTRKPSGEIDAEVRVVVVVSVLVLLSSEEARGESTSHTMVDLLRPFKYREDGRWDAMCLL